MNPPSTWSHYTRSSEPASRLGGWGGPAKSMLLKISVHACGGTGSGPANVNSPTHRAHVRTVSVVLFRMLNVASRRPSCSNNWVVSIIFRRPVRTEVLNLTPVGKVGAASEGGARTRLRNSKEPHEEPHQLWRPSRAVHATATGASSAMTNRSMSVCTRSITVYFPDAHVFPRRACDVAASVALARVIAVIHHPEASGPGDMFRSRTLVAAHAVTYCRHIFASDYRIQTCRHASAHHAATVWQGEVPSSVIASHRVQQGTWHLNRLNRCLAVDAGKRCDE